MSSQRLSQFNDGIFAFSATLLMLNFAVPAVRGQDNTALAVGLVSQWPKLLAFLLSFGVIINYWRTHGTVFHAVQVVDHRTIVLNAMFLAVTAFVPYVTNVVGSYPLLPAAAVLYSVTLLAGTYIGKLMGDHLVATNAFRGHVSPAATIAFRRMNFAVYMRIVGLLFAFFLPVVSYVLYWAIIIYYLSASGIDAYAPEESVAS
ncbi:MAG: DUF1211 domain-containing protein [Candidatus Eremiobacteraeota bacterium]|nr:DUF1211 domain-containing protein [Candidatus Eremiobacteraeota bacterium]